MKKSFKTLAYLLFIWLISTAGVNSCNNDPQIISYNNNLADLNGTKLIHLKDDGFAITANRNDSAFIYRYNNIGKFLWAYGTKINNSLSFNSITELSNQDLVTIGTTVIGNSKKLVAFRYNKNGAFINQLITDNGGKNLEGIDIKTSSDNKIYLIGKSVTNTDWGFTDIAFIKTSNTLQTEITLKNISVLNYDIVNSISINASNEILVAGASKTGMFDANQPMILKIAPTGTKVWAKTFSNRVGYQANNIVQNTQNNKLFITTAKTNTTDNTSDASILICDVNGNFIRSLEYGSTANDYAVDIAQASDNQIILLAQYGQPKENGYNKRDWLLNINITDTSEGIASQTFYDSYLYSHSPESIVALSILGTEYAYISNLSFFGSKMLKFVIQRRYNKPSGITFNNVPKHYQLYPRNLTTNNANVNISGKVTGTSTELEYNTIKVEVYKNNNLMTSQSTNVAINADLFNFDIPIHAELSNYTFKIYGIKNGISKLIYEAQDVVAGDAIMISGQSNSVGGEYYPEDRSMFIRTFGIQDTNYVFDNYIWKPEDYSVDGMKYDDIRIGGVGLKLAKDIVDNYHIPVAIINGGIPGILIDSLLRINPNNQSANTAYLNHYNRMFYSNLKDNVRAIIFFQGESDASGLYAGTTPEQYMKKFDSLNSAWIQDYPSTTNKYIFQIRPGFPYAGGDRFSFLNIEEAQRRLADSINNLSIMSVTCAEKSLDRTHYTASGYRKSGHDLFRLIANDMYNGNYTDINPPKIINAYFTNEYRTSITLEFDQSTSNLTWVNNYNEDFLLEGDTATKVVNGYFIDDHKLVLQLSRMLSSNFTGISYTSHDYGDSSSVYSSTHYIGMLCFKNYPVKSVFGNQFYQSVGWINGDQANSIPLSNGKVVWTFGDSWIDKYHVNKEQVDCGIWLAFNTRNAMISHPKYEFNQVATHKGDFNINTYGNKGLFNYNPNDTYYEWPSDGFQLGNNLYVSVGTFGTNMKQFDLHLAKFDINNLNNIIGYINVPFDTTTNLYFGNCFVDDNDPNYIYSYAGIRDNITITKLGRLNLLDLFDIVNFKNVQNDTLFNLVKSLLEYNQVSNATNIQNNQDIIDAVTASTLDSLVTFGISINLPGSGICLARLSKSNLTSWQYWTGNSWSNNIQDTRSIYNSNKTQNWTSGCYTNKIGNKYVCISTQMSWSGGASRGKKIFASYSDYRQGPFTDPELIYTIPDVINYNGDTYPAFYYSVFPHPEYTTADGLTPVTYCVNNGENCTNGGISPNYYKPKIFWYNFNNLTGGNLKVSNNNSALENNQPEEPTLVYPNPTDDGIVNIKTNVIENTQITISVYTLDGKLVSYNLHNSKLGENIISIQLPSEKAYYIVNVISTNGEQKAFKVLNR
jgi:hypothetical protein